MKRSRKSSRVCWASGVKLCQVKLFSSEDCPAKVGLKSEDHLQAKTSYHYNRMEATDLPPGFERSCVESHLKKELVNIRRIKWKCPPKFVISHNWQVVAGEESTEAEAQKLREARVLEAVYPRSSFIPPSPSVSRDIECELYDDSLTPLVSLTPIEEEESGDLPSDLTIPGNTTVCPLPVAMPQGPVVSCTMNTPKSSALEGSTSEKPTLGSLPSLGTNVIAAASTALAATLQSKQPGSLIDTDLLIKILSDPKMIQGLINDQPPPVKAASVPANATATAPVYASKVVTPVTHPPVSKPLEIQNPVSGNLYQVLNGVRPSLNTIPPPQPESGVRRGNPLVAVSSSETNLVLPSNKPVNGSHFTVPNQVRATYPAMPAPPKTAPLPTLGFMEARPVKDANYYKNLIRQHGGEKQETQNGNLLQDMKLVQNIKAGELKPKSKKRCIYFNGPKGCRNGQSCPFQHDGSMEWRTGSVLEDPSAKRMRLGGEIAGRI